MTGGCHPPPAPSDSIPVDSTIGSPSLSDATPARMPRAEGVVLMLSLTDTPSQSPSSYSDGLNLGSPTQEKRRVPAADASHAVGGEDPHDAPVSLGSPCGGSKEPRASKKRSIDTLVTPTKSPFVSPSQADEGLGFCLGGVPLVHCREQKIQSEYLQVALGESTRSGELNLGFRPQDKRTVSPPDPSHAVAGDDRHDDAIGLEAPGGRNKEPRASKKRSISTQVTLTKSPSVSPSNGDESLGFGIGGEPSVYHREKKTPSDNLQAAPSESKGSSKFKDRMHQSPEIPNHAIGNQNAPPKMRVQRRKLPGSMTSRPSEESWCISHAQKKSLENSSSMVPHVTDDEQPMNLLDCIRVVSKMLERRSADIDTDTDLLKVKKMKGIEFRWLRRSQNGGSDL